MEDLLAVIIYIGTTAVVGCLWGLIPFFLGRHRYRPNMGRLGLIWCGVAGPFLLAFFVMLGFVIAILVSERDARSAQRSSGTYAAAAYAPPAAPPARGGLALNCLAGPLAGQTYPLGVNGLMLGRDTDCTVRFPSDTAGISRHHCALRWKQGVPVLVDLGSAYGTYMGDGRRLPPNYPMNVGPGTRFYLSSPGNLFQITVI